MTDNRIFFQDNFFRLNKMSTRVERMDVELGLDCYVISGRVRTVCSIIFYSKIPLVQHIDRQINLESIHAQRLPPPDHYSI